MTNEFQDYYDRKHAEANEAYAKLQELIKAGAPQAEIKAQELKLERARYVGD